MPRLLTDLLFLPWVLLGLAIDTFVPDFLADLPPHFTEPWLLVED